MSARPAALAPSAARALLLFRDGFVQQPPWKAKAPASLTSTIPFGAKQKRAATAGPMQSGEPCDSLCARYRAIGVSW